MSALETPPIAGHCARRVYATVRGTELPVPATETQQTTQLVRLRGSTVSQKIIAGAIILLFCYYAQGVVITLLLAILLAYFLDPAVELLERMHIARTIGSMLMVLLLIAGLGGLGYLTFTRTADFAANWPKYSAVLQKAANNVETKIRKIEGASDTAAAQPPGAAQPVERREESQIVHNLLTRAMGSLYALFLEVTFVPFLVFFMLAGKREVWHGTLQLFPAAKRTQVKETLEDLREVLKDYLAGMTVVTLMVIAMSSLFFWIMGMDFPILTGVVSGIFNMVPYIGAVLAWLPAFIIALVKWNSVTSFLLIAGVLTGIHVVAQNLVAPELVGRRVRLNAVAITVALLFWGWVWGGMGLILAIPITASLRVICERTEGWKPIGRWMSA